MTTGNERSLGKILMVRELTFSLEAFKHIVETFDPSVFKVAAGVVKLHTSRRPEDATHEDLLKYDANKPGDIIIWASLSPKARMEYIDFVGNSPLPPDAIASETTIKKLNAIGVIMLTYFMHGSLQGLSFDKVQVPKFALNCVGMKPEEFAIGNVSSSPAFVTAKFGKTVEAFNHLFHKFPKTLQSRVKLGFAGNRVFGVLRMVKSAITDSAAEYEVIAHLLSDPIMNGAPYVSFHPDHKANPMGDGAKKLIATIGHLIVNANITIESLVIRNKGLMIDGFVAALTASKDDIPGNMPSLSIIKTATGLNYSLGARTAGLLTPVKQKD